MCGIAGIIGNNQENEHLMTKMLQIQNHRGPDATDFWTDKNCIFGHNRLSIIDLSQTANQPMHSECDQYVIVFNGEIYNYLELKNELKKEYNFKTNSDTEVILAGFKKWGKKILNELNGMFSFAIWDKKNQVLFAARDRFGVKPFYYSFKEGQFFFASEIKTLWAANIKKNRNNKVWANYLVHASYGLPNETFWENIYQLPAAHYFEIDFKNGFDDIKTFNWYNFIENIHNISTVTNNNLEETYFNLLQDAIKLRFRSDVPIGLNVSGGLDSSTLIILVQQYLKSSESIEGFTFFSGNKNYDELPWVRAIMKKTSFKLNEVKFNVNEIPNLISEIAAVQDEPFGGFPTLAYSLLFKEASKKGIKVLLDGQGMDEAWAGYDYYHNNSNSVIQGIKTSPVRPEILEFDFKNLSKIEEYPKPFDNDLQNLQYRDLFYTKIPRALRFNDRISMKYGTELREPFLDYRLVELAFAQPENKKLQNGQTKWMLRELVKKYLGDDLALAPKRALQTPQREWIANELKDYVFHQIEIFSTNDFVNKLKINQIWNDYLNGKQDNSFYIWQWINIAALMNKG